MWIKYLGYIREMNKWKEMQARLHHKRQNKLNHLYIKSIA